MSRSLKFFVMGVSAVTVAFGLLTWFDPFGQGNDSVTTGTLVKRLGYLEIVPPSTFYGPGTINTVETIDATRRVQLWPTCRPNEEALRGRSLASETVDRTIVDRLDKGFDISAQIKTMLTSGIAANKIREVSISLRNVSIILMADEDLLDIRNSLLKDSCEAAVIHNLRNGSVVCQSRGVIKADAVYKITFSSGTKVSEQASLREEIATKLSVRANRAAADEISGSGLFYGVKLMPTGIVLDGARIASCRAEELLAHFGTTSNS